MFDGSNFSQIITQQGALVKISGRLDSVDDLPIVGSYNQMFLIGLETATTFTKYLWNVATQSWDEKGISQMMDWNSKKAPTTFVIAPSNAVNKEGADLILTGINDAAAINAALSELTTPIILMQGNIVTDHNTSVDLDAGASDVDDFYNGYTIVMNAAEYIITDYTGATRNARTSGHATLPDGTAYIIKQPSPPIRVDFLGGDIIAEVRIVCSYNNVHLYGNGVNISGNLSTELLSNTGANCEIINFNITNNNGTGGTPIGVKNTGANCVFTGNNFVVIGNGIGCSGFDNSGYNCIITGNTCTGNGTAFGIKNTGYWCIITGNMCSSILAGINQSGNYCQYYGNIENGAVSKLATLDANNALVQTLPTTNVLTIKGLTLVGADSVANKVLTIRGMLSQTGNLQEWQSSTAAVLASVCSDGKIGVGIVPTALIHPKAGTTSCPPFKLTQAGAAITSIGQAGAIECNDGDNLYYTIKTGTARKCIVLTDGLNLIADRVPVVTTSGRLIDYSGFTYAASVLGAPVISATSFLLTSIITGIIASVTQTQAGGTALTKDINIITVCANANDAVTLPSAATGRVVKIINKGVNNVWVFPFLADDLGIGVNTVSANPILPGHCQTYIAYNSTYWIELLS